MNCKPPIEVILLFDDRDATKLERYSQLSERLCNLGFIVKKIEPSQNLIDVIKNLRPSFLILDYLIGDITTGLDLLNELNKEGVTRTTDVLFYTDESVVSVAVEAMRLGALHYFTTDFSTTDEIVDCIHNQVKTKQVEEYTAKRNRLVKNLPAAKIEDIPCKSQCSINLYEFAKLIVSKRPKLAYIRGDQGTGKSFVARAICSTINPKGYVQEHDCSVEQLPSTKTIEGKNILIDHLNNNISLILDNVDIVSPKLIDLVKMITAILEDTNTMAIICSSNEESIRELNSIFKGDVIEIPNLSSRKEDIAILAEKFAKIAGSHYQAKEGIINCETVTWLEEQNWPGNIRELRDVIINSCICSLGSKQNPQDILLANKEIWERYNLPLKNAASPTVPDELLLIDLMACEGDLHKFALKHGLPLLEAEEYIKGLLDHGK